MAKRFWKRFALLYVALVINTGGEFRTFATLDAEVRRARRGNIAHSPAKRLILSPA